MNDLTTYSHRSLLVASPSNGQRIAPQSERGDQSHTLPELPFGEDIGANQDNAISAAIDRVPASNYPNEAQPPLMDG
jgi:hypothetical protein